MSEFPPLVYVDIIKAKVRFTPGRRAQPWRWVAKSADNQKKLARSTERYTNRNDALDAIHLLFGAHTTVFLRRREVDGWPVASLGNELLRRAA